MTTPRTSADHARGFLTAVKCAESMLGPDAAHALLTTKAGADASLVIRRKASSLDVVRLRAMERRLNVTR